MLQKLVGCEFFIFLNVLSTRFLLSLFSYNNNIKKINKQFEHFKLL